MPADLRTSIHDQPNQPAYWEDEDMPYLSRDIEV